MLTHPEPRQLGVRCLAQGSHHSRGIEGGENARYSHIVRCDLNVNNLADCLTSSVTGMLIMLNKYMEILMMAAKY